MSDIYQEALDRLSRVAGVRGALIVESEAGLPVMSELTAEVEGDKIAALAASLFRRTSKAAGTANFGSVRTLQLESDDGHVIVANGGELLVVVVAEKTAQLGQVRLEAHRAAEALQ